MQLIKWVFFTSLIAICSCKNEPKHNSLDLMQYGMPIKVNAPEDSNVESTDYGFAKDVTIKAGEDFDVQIISGNALELDVKKIVQAQKSEVENSLYFSKLVQEDENGFIFEKKITEEKLKYDFRIVKIQGDKEYIFQSGLTGNFDQKQIENMYNALK